MSLGRLGVWAFTEQMTATETADFARRLEEWNYDALWIPEARGRNSLVHAGWLLSATRRLHVATGIANIWARDAMAMQAARHTLNEQSGGRFVLGLGVSHAPLVEKLRGHNYDKPLQFMAEYLETMARAKYDAPILPDPGEVVLAALRPKMLELSRDRADGAHPYNVNPEHTHRARQILGPNKRLYVEQAVVLDTEAERARRTARDFLSIYLKLPNYRNNWLWLGFSEEDLNDVSDHFVDSIVAWGDERALRGRVREHWSAGADHVCVQALTPGQATKIDQNALEVLAPVKEWPST